MVACGRDTKKTRYLKENGNKKQFFHSKELLKLHIKSLLTPLTGLAGESYVLTTSRVTKAKLSILFRVKDNG